MKAFVSSNFWFGASLALVGIIAGYGIGMGVNGTTQARTAQQPSQVAQQPQIPPTPNQLPPAPTAQNVPPIDPENDHIRGNPNAMIAVIEYSDFECPFCKRHHPTMKQILEEYDGRVSWVYRHFPLSFHPNAQPAAEAAECAGDLGGNDVFWQFTDIIFEKGAERDNLALYAEELNLNPAKFQSCLESGKFTQHVSDDMAGGAEAGVSGTPGNIVYNLKTKEARLVSGAQPLENFKAVIDEMLSSEAQAKQPSTPPGRERTAMVHVTNWSFTPETIMAKKGEKLSLNLMGMEGDHGFAIPGLGVSEAVPAGGSVTVDIPTDKSGTFEFFCNVPCGEGHRNMKGTLVIE